MENAWTIIRELGYQDVYDELGGIGGDIHRLQNVMTLKTNLQDIFDKLALWFESTVGRIHIPVPPRPHINV